MFGVGKKKDDKKKKGGDDEWAKHATIFKLGSKLAVKKTIAFSYDKDVHVEVNYEESDNLPIGTGLSIEQYDVSGIADFAKEMADKKLGTPKVSLQFELDSSGITKLIKAEAVVEETVMVDEEVEVDDDDGGADEKAEEKKDEEKKDDTPAETESEKKEGDADADADADGKDEKKEEKKKKKTITVQKVSYLFVCLLHFS